MKPILKNLEIFVCPMDHCRKTSNSLKGLNVHLVRKHNSPFLIELIDGNKPIARTK